MKLFGYWRSSATYRVRIALALKGLDYAYEAVDLLRGDQAAEAYRARNPQGLVPALLTDEGETLTQSLAIVEYLEERYPDPPLLPDDVAGRARARGIAATLACEGQPFMNLRVQRYLRDEAGFDDARIADWLDRWAGGALAAVEPLLDPHGPFALGATPGLADAFLIPQLYGARRFGVDLSGLTRALAVEAACADRPAFAARVTPRPPSAATGDRPCSP